MVVGIGRGENSHIREFGKYARDFSFLPENKLLATRQSRGRKDAVVTGRTWSSDRQDRAGQVSLGSTLELGLCLDPALC